MEKFNQLIEIVKDPEKKKLRARCLHDGRWNRFPNNLRKLNKLYLAKVMKQGRGDSWIPGKVEEFVVDGSKNSVLEEMLSLTNKKLLESFYSVIYESKNKKINTEMLNIMFMIKQVRPAIDQQILLPLIKKYSHSAFLKEELVVPLTNMLCSYNDKRVVSLFSNYKEEDFLEDTVMMYQSLLEQDLNIDSILPSKPKDFRELHQLFTKECMKTKRPNNNLKQDLDHLLGLSVGDYKIFVPYNSKELIEIGGQMGICVGNGLYARKILKKECRIIALVDKDNKFKYCIEFTDSRILQARGKHNRSMEEKLVKELRSTIFNAPKQAVA